MKIFFSILIGYLLGSLSPAALIAKLKHTDLRSCGTHNLGASNTTMVIGKGYGAFVMLFDIAKAFFSVKLAKLLFPSVALAGIIAGSSAVVGHIFPFYLKFKGGKGLASFGGLILGTDPVLFMILLAISLTLMFIINYSAAMPMSAGVLFPILYAIRTGDLAATLIAAAVSILIICKHFGNIGKARRGEDVKIREYAKKLIFGR